jgi:hypothetical protein
LNHLFGGYAPRWSALRSGAFANEEPQHRPSWERETIHANNAEQAMPAMTIADPVRATRPPLSRPDPRGGSWRSVRPTSSLTGTWRGTVTIQINPGDPNPPAPTSGDMTWTFEVVPQTNMQSLRATIRSTHPWLTMETTGSTALSPGNSPPTEISTHGEFNSPRGCRGTFGSVGTAEATRIEADFSGTDCQLATFTGRVVLTKG